MADSKLVGEWGGGGGGGGGRRGRSNLSLIRISFILKFLDKSENLDTFPSTSLQKLNKFYYL